MSVYTHADCRKYNHKTYQGSTKPWGANCQTLEVGEVNCQKETSLGRINAKYPAYQVATYFLPIIRDKFQVCTT